MLSRLGWWIGCGALALGCGEQPRPMSSHPPSTPSQATPAFPTSAEPAGARAQAVRALPRPEVETTPPPQASPPPPDAPPDAPPPPAPPPRPRSLTIAKGTRVLMVGDSMVFSGLGFSLKRLVEHRGATMTLTTQRNATTVMYNHEPQLGELLESVDPDVVIIALGSNELFLPSPEMREGDIKGIVSIIGERPCVWIGPNPWAIEKGMLGVLKRSSAPCRYFDSSKLTFEHQQDGVHPTLRGGGTWANAVWKKYFEH